MGLFKKTKAFSITISRAISEMETIQCLLTSDDINEFSELVQKAELAIQWRADQFQNQLVDVQEALEASRAAKVAKMKGTK